MNILSEPGRARGEWRFHFLGIPVRVHPWFWMTTLFMGASNDTGAVLIWLAVCFVSILIHELGHVFAFRAFGVRADVVLYSWGGLAVPNGGSRLGTFGQLVVSLAGPFAGFGFAAAVSAVALLAGATFHLSVHTVVMPSLSAVVNGSYYWNVLLNDLLWVNISWGLLNLLPIYPLDGGQAARALMTHHDPLRGRRRSLILSVTVGVVMAALGLYSRSIYMVALFGILAAGSAQALEADKPVFKPYESWRR
jgi:stage IV sporulation protein FB